MTASSYANETLGLVYLKQANVELIHVARAEKNFLLASDLEEREKYKSALAKFMAKVNENLDKGRPLMHSEQGKALVANVDRAWNERVEAGNQMMALAEKDPLQQKRASVEFSIGSERQKTDAAENALVAVEDFKQEHASRDAETIDQTYRGSRTFLLIMVVSGVLTGLGLGIFISRSISKPMGQLAEIARHISLGDVNQTVDYHSGDEVGSLP